MSLAIVQARMLSQRFPGKVLKDICGKPMLERVIERVRKSSATEIIVATSNDESNKPIYDLCERIGVRCFPYPYEKNVLQRFYLCALGFHKEDPILRITGDCPLVDPKIIDLVISNFKNQYDLVSTSSGYPDGMDVEAFSFAALIRSWREATSQEDLEHVTTYMIKHYRVLELKIDHKVPKLSVDSQVELGRVIDIYKKFGDNVSLEQIIGLYG